MIYYFSGTGNSYAVAKILADNLYEPLQDIAQAVKEKQYSYTFSEGERLGIVFPVYTAAPPKIVLDFINQLELDGSPYTFVVCTCGDSAGKSIDFVEKILAKKGCKLHSGFSVVMPNNHITLFEGETDASLQEKLVSAEQTIARIQKAILQEKTNFFRVKREKISPILAYIVNPIFQKKGTQTKPFFVTDSCISCGLCEKVCNAGCIKLTNGKPVWTEQNCAMCLACLNRCPVTAIQYGKKTANRNRYVHPIYQTKKTK